MKKVRTSKLQNNEKAIFSFIITAHRECVI